MHARTRPALILLVLMLSGTITCGCSPDSDSGDELTPAVVLRVVDGDTAVMLVGGTKERVRFIGVDTPESTREIEPFGEEASDYTRQALDGRNVWIETDAEPRDRYDRLLAYVWLERPDDRSDAEVRAKQLNALLLLDGYANMSTYPPNVRYVDSYRIYQREAREAKRGSWANDR